jgi:hypothetical protein
LKLYELFVDRIEEGPIDNVAFAAMLAKIAKEFETQQPKRRCGGGGRCGPSRSIRARRDRCRAARRAERGAVMFLPERYRRQPWRRPSAQAPEPAPDPPVEAEPDAWDEADALAALPDDEFLKQLRADVNAVAAGTLPGGLEAYHPVTKPKVRRDRHGRAL